MTNIIIGSPHLRNAKLAERIQQRIPNANTIRVSSHEELMSIDLVNFSPDWIFFPHWSWKVPSEIFSSYNCVIFHMTDLPFGRGGTPLQNLITRGIDNTKICALKCEEGIDTGPVFCRKPLSLNGTAEEILTRANRCIEEMIAEIVLTNPEALPQEGEVVLFKRRTPQQSNIANLITISDVYDHIRMLDAKGYPTAYFSTLHHNYSFTNVQRDGDELVATVRISMRDTL